MLDLLRKLFSPEYRKAVAAEAAGDYLSAARSYALCGDHAKVADMHLARARGEGTLDGKIRALRTALDFAHPGESSHAFVARQLADCIRAKADGLDPLSPTGRSQLAEACELLESGGAWADAGECYLVQGEIDAACRAFGRAGMVERVEQILTEREGRQTDERICSQSFADYRLAMAEGARVRAQGELRRCVQHAASKGQYQRLLTDLSARLPSDGHLDLSCAGASLRIIGSLPAVLGRDEECAIPLRGPSVSRHHARVSRQADTAAFEIEDAGSRNGTLVDNLLIAERVPLHQRTTIRLGSDLPLLTVLLLSDSPPILSLEISEGIDRGRQFVLCTQHVDLSLLVEGAAPLRVAFVDRIPRLSGISEPLLLNGSAAGRSIEPLVGDLISVGDSQVQVR